MASPPYESIAELIDPVTMAWVLDDSLNHGAIVKLCNACALSYDGTRTKSIPTKRLILDLVEEFYKDEGNAKIITKALRRTNADLMRRIGKLSVEEIQALLEDGPRDGKVGSFLFALAADARAQVNDLVEEAAESLYEHEEDRMYEEFEYDEEEEDDSLLHEILDKNEQLTHEVERLRSEHKKLEKERAEQEKRTRQFIEERRSLQTKIADMQRELTTAQRTARGLEEENTRLVGRLEEVETTDTAVLSASLNQLIRDNRKVHYHLERWAEVMEKKEEPEPFVGALGEMISDIRRVLAEQGSESPQERVAIRKGLEEMRGEIRGVQAEMRKLQDMGLGKPLKPHGDAKRVGIFVDVQNVFYAARHFNARLDFEKLLESTVGDRRLIRAIAYVVRSPEVDQSGFITMLQQKSYEVRQKDLRLRSDGSAKGDWDMGMAIDVINLADKLDVVVLVSGDGDFVALVNLIKTIGPEVEVFSFPHNTARDLMQVADRYYPIEDGMMLRTFEGDDV